MPILQFWSQNTQILRGYCGEVGFDIPQPWYNKSSPLKIGFLKEKKGFLTTVAFRGELLVLGSVTTNNKP